MGLGDLYDRMGRILTMDRRVHVLEDLVQGILARQEAMSVGLVRLDARIETVKAETLAKFYRQLASAPAPRHPGAADRPALPSRRKTRRPR